MKLATKYLESIAGVEIYPIFSLLIFVIFFLAVTWYVLKLDKSFIEEMSNYPSLNDESNHEINNE